MFNFYTDKGQEQIRSTMMRSLGMICEQRDALDEKETQIGWYRDKNRELETEVEQLEAQIRQLKGEEVES